MEENEYHEPSFGEIVDLVKQFEEADKLKHQVFFEEDSYEQIIRFYQDNREFGKALKVIEAAIAQHTFSSFFYTKKAEMLANQKRFEEAMAILEESERLDPNDINIFLIRSDIHLWEGRHQEAQDEVEYALTIATEDEDKCELYLELADIYEDQEKYPEVVNALKSALYMDPANEEGLNRFWFCTELTGAYNESVKFHEELIDLDPYSYLAWFNLGHAYAGLQDYEKSLEAFGFVTAIEDTYDAAYICSGDVLYNMGRYEESVNYYLDAIKLSKPNKELYLKTAESYEKLGELSKSRSYLRKSISVDPYFDEAFYRIGETYRQEEKWPKAISSYERAVKLSKDNIDYLSALADAYLCFNEGEMALEIYEKIFQIDTQNKQSWVNLATAYFNVDNFRKAFQVLTEAEMKYEGQADLLYIKSVFYFQVGNRHEALINLERGLLMNFDEHRIIFDMDESLKNDAAVIQVIEQYRD
ncbi:MAG TPA: tetratricopeptide repeat protein [Chitinophagales bacterium]|nr:tetratricopeptide repeat protein [Chitinophagales bacterium]